MDIVNITDDLFLGKGGHRACYRHPVDKTKCIKIILNSDGARTVNFELDFLRTLHKRGFYPKLIPGYYGMIETSKGTGYVYDLVENADGTPALTLDDFLKNPQMLKEHQERLLELMCSLHKDLYDNQVIVRSLEAWNVLFPQAADGTLSIRLVNDLGMPNKLKIPYHISYAAHKHVEKHWKKFKHDMRPYYKGIQEAQHFIDLL
ncbi:PhoP regulatory network protein YrbL [Dialister histaminiformans]|uniref:PhoP regulatory network protein YrbL n=1 Tax=Allisonella histaminiformans TaxID=209880 RepID=A0A1G5WAG7_9FIRM|nr:YrbL family protein [Allisonella histaminiformans]SDA55012.1 PhoP regulatory network protein YrbL [Allisonella histaminiformans]